MQRKLEKLSISRNKHFSVISSTYNQPIKRFLNSYSMHQNLIGYNNGQQISATLENLAKLVSIQGKNPNTFGDYNYYGACSSPQMKTIINDFEYCIGDNEIFFAPLHLAISLSSLVKLGYRDTELYKKLWQKIIRQSSQKAENTKTTEQLFDQANKGGQQNWRNPGYYVYKGFEDSQSFNQMFQILMKWKTVKQSGSQQKSSNETQIVDNYSQKEYNHIVRQLQKISQLSIDTKNMQTKLLTSLTQLRRQYFKVIQQLDKRKFLRENPYIFYDILELQQQLVEAGIIEPQDLMNSQSYFQSFQTRMKKAADSFYELAGMVFPQALSPNIDQFYNAAMQSSKKQARTQQNEAVNFKQSHNNFSPKILARCLESLASMTYSNRKDISQVDDKNGRIAKILPANSNYKKKREEMKRDKNIQNDQQLNKSIIPPHFTTMWEIMQAKFCQVYPIVLNQVKSEKCDMETLMRFSSAFGMARIGKFTDLNNQIIRKLETFNKQELKSHWNSVIERLGYRQSSQLLVNFISNRPSSSIGVEAIWNKYQNDADGDNLFDLQSALNTAWAYSASQFFNNQLSKKQLEFNKSLFLNIVSYINRSNLLSSTQLEVLGNPGQSLNAESKARKLNDVVSMMQKVFQKQTIEKYAISLVNTRQDIIQISRLYEDKFTNPIKDRVVRYIKQLLEDRMHFQKDKKSLIESWSYQSMIQNKFAGAIPDFVTGFKGNKIVSDCCSLD